MQAQGERQSWSVTSGQRSAINLDMILLLLSFYSAAVFALPPQDLGCDPDDLGRRCLEPGVCSKEPALPDRCGLGLVCCRPGPVGSTSRTKRVPPASSRNSTLSQRTLSKSHKMCLKYAESVYKWEESPVLLPGAPPTKIDLCAITEEALIVGGVKAKPREFPHMALIGYGEEDDVFWLCGGSLVSDRFVLSAAHCVDSGETGPARWATLGDLRVLEEGEDADPVTSEIVERAVHPGYSKDTVYHDLALFKLRTSVAFSAWVRPACLAPPPAHSPITEATATGWGNTKWHGLPTKDMMKVNLPVLEGAECGRAFNRSTKVPRGIDPETMICAGGVVGKDTCQGDSGGPLQVALREPYCMYHLLGVTSFGGQCAKGLPGVYTRLSHYLPWIESVVWPQ